MRTLQEQTAQAAELAEIRQGLLDLISGARLLVQRVDRLAAHTTLPVPRESPAALTVVPEPEAPPVASEPEEPKEPDVEDEFEDEPREPPIDFSVGSFGKIYLETAQRKAEVLGEFTTGELAQALGLKPSVTNGWLSKLVDAKTVTFDAGSWRAINPPSVHTWVIDQKAAFTVAQVAEVTHLSTEAVQAEIDALLERKIVKLGDEGTYEYTDPPGYLSPNHHPHRAPPEKDRPSYSDAPPRGEPVRIRKDTRRQRSVAGAGGIKGVRQRNRRFDEMQEAKAARAAAQSAKDKERYGGSGAKGNSKKAQRRAKSPA